MSGPADPSAARATGPPLVRAAVPADVEGLWALIESAYRGEGSKKGWTTEADLVDGPRTTAEEVAAVVAGPDSMMLVAESGGRLVGCCQLTRTGEGDGYFGMFAVRPELQGGGIGRALLSSAEAGAARWGCRRMVMWVLDRRPELLAWYRRRGYAPTGDRVPFPREDAGRGPKLPGLEFVVLARELSPEPGQAPHDPGADAVAPDHAAG